MRERDDIEIEDRERSAPAGSEGSTDSGDSRSTRETDVIADELGRIDVMTTTEGYVESRITGLTAVDEHTVRLDVRLPHGTSVSFDLEKPIPWSREFLLARVVEDVGYDAASIDHVVGERVYVARADVGDDAAFSWWTASARDLGRTLFARVGKRLDLQVRRTAEWQLVDPRERVDEDDGTGPSNLVEPAAVAGILIGAALAVIGAVVGATGGFALAGSVLAYALPGLALIVLGLAVLVGVE